MGFNPASYFGNDGEWMKLERTINSFGALSGRLQAAKYDLQALGDAYRKAMLEVPDLTFDQGGGGVSSTPAPAPSPAASEAEARRKEA